MPDYVQQFRQLLPKGKVWETFYGTTLYQVVEGLVVEFGRVHQRAADLLLEMDPRTVTELIDDWERNWGLPDPCAPAPTTIEGRRAALTARVISRGGWTGGPSVPFLQSVASALGYELLVRRFMYQPFTCESECDDFLNTWADGWMFVWEFVAVHDSENGLDAVLECQLTRYSLSALGLSFAFPLFELDDATFTRSSTATFTDPIDGNQTSLSSGQLGEVYAFGTNLDTPDPTA